MFNSINLHQYMEQLSEKSSVALRMLARAVKMVNPTPTPGPFKALENGWVVRINITS